MRTSGLAYRLVTSAIEREREKLSALYRNATSVKARETIVRKARRLVVDRVDRALFPFWYGTRWHFYGTTTIPRKGTIACGYFVTTILSHAGFNVQRALLAQQPSMFIIWTLTSRPFIKTTYGLKILRFVEGLRRMGNGLYVVGLDCHVGFLVVRSGRVFFVHASYGTPAEVVREDALTSPILASSRYRMVGKISGDRRVIVKWLKGERFVTRRWKQKRR